MHPPIDFFTTLGFGSAGKIIEVGYNYVILQCKFCSRIDDTINLQLQRQVCILNNSHNITTMPIFIIEYGAIQFDSSNCKRVLILDFHFALQGQLQINQSHFRRIKTNFTNPCSLAVV